MVVNRISDISNYTVALYRERFMVSCHLGSGLLIRFQNRYFLISAYHVFDMEEERIEIENDPYEKDIPQDDMESIMAKGNGVYFYVDNSLKGLVFTTTYNEETKKTVFNYDLEWCICELSQECVKYFHDFGKSFFEINDCSKHGIESGKPIIITGFPGYAQKKDKEVYRSYRGEFMKYDNMYHVELFRIKFENTKAFNYEMNTFVEIPPIEGISGMSGGGLWHKEDDSYIPCGIIIKQDPINKYVEGVYLSEIIKSISEQYE